MDAPPGPAAPGGAGAATDRRDAKARVGDVRAMLGRIRDELAWFRDGGPERRKAYRAGLDEFETGYVASLVTMLFDELRKWSEKPRWTGSGITRLALELADLPGHPARTMARRHKAEVQGWLASMLQRTGAPRASRQARELQLLIEGAGILMLISGDRTYADTGAALARRLLK